MFKTKMAEDIEVYDVANWLEQNKHDFHPPVCVKMMHSNQLDVFYVGGPNERSDFHIEEGEEFFYMRKGAMCLRVFEQGQFRDIHIREGEVFLLPGRVPHSPQRQQNTIGLVIERQRAADEFDCLRYYQEGSTNILYERWFYSQGLKGIGDIIKGWHQSEEKRTGKPKLDSVNSNPPFAIESYNTVPIEPFNIYEWISDHKTHIQIYGSQQLFGKQHNTQITVYGSGSHQISMGNSEVFIWQLRGQCLLVVDNGERVDLKTDSHAIVGHQPDLKSNIIDISSSADSRTMVLIMATPTTKKSVLI